MKNHKEIDLGPGQTIDAAIEKMSQYDYPVFIEFNGQKLYSDIDNIETAYLKITGRTKAEFDRARQNGKLEYEKRKQQHQKAIPLLTKQWIRKGNEILAKKYRDEWAKIVPVRLNDIYDGVELEDSLGVIKVLNSGLSLESAKAIIQSQGHSGASFSIVLQIVSLMCDRGIEFKIFMQKK